MKICGITSLDDALWAVQSGADALGLIFYPRSPRFVPPKEATRIVERLKGIVPVVGVFVNEDPGEVLSVARTLGLDFIQLHGHEDPHQWAAKLGPPLIKAVRANEREISTLGSWFHAWAVLVDGFDPSEHSSTGKVADWSLASTLRFLPRLILAGGLHEGNLLEAVRKVRPDAVDVNSGVEASPGRKDPQKMKRIVALAKTVCFGQRAVFTSMKGGSYGTP